MNQITNNRPIQRYYTEETTESVKKQASSSENTQKSPPPPPKQEDSYEPSQTAMLISMSYMETEEVQTCEEVSDVALEETEEAEDSTEVVGDVDLEETVEVEASTEVVDDVDLEETEEVEDSSSVNGYTGSLSVDDLLALEMAVMTSQLNAFSLSMSSLDSLFDYIGDSGNYFSDTISASGTDGNIWYDLAYYDMQTDSDYSMFSDYDWENMSSDYLSSLTDDTMSSIFEKLASIMGSVDTDSTTEDDSETTVDLADL